MKAGYKQTEVGVIPEEWEVVSLGSVLTICHGKNQALVSSPTGDYPILATGGKIGTATRWLYDKPSVLIGRKGTINAPQYMDTPFWTVDTLFYSEVKAENYAKFLYYCFCLIDWMQYNEASGVPSLNARTIESIKIACPTPTEQRAIATALSDMDALLDGLDRLIAKKRDIKQATMQQLLTGKTRLPGFSGAWEVKRLGDLASLKSGESITAERIDDSSEFPCYGGNGLRGYTKTNTHEGNYALIGRQGALCGNVISASGKFFASEHAIVVTPKANIAIQWLACILADANLNQYSESSAQPGLSATKLLVLEFNVPPTKEEQTAIANILSDMDAEITALETRRDKTRDIKQAMMQELLTGRTRLV